MSSREALDRDGLRAYLRRVSDRWPLEGAHLGGSRVAGGDGEPAFFVVLVSSGFDGVPWLERVRQAELLWDSAEMGGRAEVHCYTPVEFERKVASLPAVREAAESGLDLMA